MKEHFKTLDFLRGLAALSVVLFHFSNAALPTINNNLLSDLFFYGQYGVQVFFVISGFVIPYSMAKSNYKIADYFSNLLRRFIRISPPSYVAILLTFALYFSSILIINRPINGMEWPGINTISILGNITYTVPYLNTMWFNPVFWTLAIEFQFYMIIGLLLPIIMTRNKNNIIIALTLILLAGFINFNWFFKYASFFILGIIIFLKKEKIISRDPLILISIITLILCFYQNNISEFTFGVASFLLILFNFEFNFKGTNHLGTISYSLYIIHNAIGGISEIILKRITNIHEYPAGKILMLFTYTAITILFASLFHYYIEKPFIQLSKKVKINLLKTNKQD